MNNNKILIILTTALIIAGTLFLSDGLTYLVVTLMALIILFVIQTNRPRVMKMTRWAKANPRSAQVFITVLQLALIALALLTGYNLKQLGYEFSNTTAHVFTAIGVIGFLSVPFLPKRKNIAIPSQVNRHRLAYMGIALSTFVLVAFTGNRIGDVYPDSVVTQVLDNIDQSIFSDALPYPEDESTTGQIGHNQSESDFGKESLALAVFAAVKPHGTKTNDPSVHSFNVKPGKDFKKASKAKKKAERKAKKEAKKKLKKVRKDLRKKWRKAAAGGACAVAILLIILLLAPLCAGICLIIGAWGNTGVLSILAGVAITGGSVWAMIKVGQWCGRSKSW